MNRIDRLEAGVGTGYARALDKIRASRTLEALQVAVAEGRAVSMLYRSQEREEPERRDEMRRRARELYTRWVEGC
jgi:hypothetical protein